MECKSALNRREFFQAVGLSAGVIALGGTASAFGAGKEFLRPPGALPEAEFLARCMKCQKCLKVCPTKVIQPLSLGEGLQTVSTPVLKFSHGYCNLCMRCTEVCPSGALQPTKPDKVNIGLAKVNSETCVAWEWAGCIQCFQQCPEKAISLDDKQRPVVDREKCNGCGLCEAICPSASLRAYSSKAQLKGITVVPRPGR